MLKRALQLMLYVALALPMFTSPGRAQETAIVQATATVLSALTIVGNNDLRFGTVTPGVDKSVDRTDVGFAGEWEITGAPSAEISLDFTLPSDLILVDSTVQMPITFTNTDASYEDGTGGGQTAPAGTVNPLGPSTETIGVGGTLFIWIGGRVSPGLTQTGGDYAADVMLTVAYTGG